MTDSDIQHSAVFIPFLNAVAGVNGPREPPLDRSGAYYPARDGTDGRELWGDLVAEAKRKMPPDVKQRLKAALSRPRNYINELEQEQYLATLPRVLHQRFSLYASWVMVSSGRDAAASRREAAASRRDAAASTRGVGEPSTRGRGAPLQPVEEEKDEPPQPPTTAPGSEGGAALPATIARGKVSFVMESNGELRTYYGQLSPTGQLEFRDDDGRTETRDPAGMALRRSVFRDHPFPASRDEDVLTRRDHDSLHGTLDMTAIQQQLDAYNARAQHPGALDWMYDMVNDQAAERRPNGLGTRNARDPVLVPVPPHRADEMRYEMQCWVGRYVSKLFAVDIAGVPSSSAYYDYERFYGQIIGVVMRKEKRAQFLEALPSGYKPAPYHEPAEGARIMYRTKNDWRVGIVLPAVERRQGREGREGRSRGHQKDQKRFTLRLTYAQRDRVVTDDLPTAKHWNEARVRSQSQWGAKAKAGDWVLLEEGVVPQSSNATVSYVLRSQYVRSDGVDMENIDLIALRHDIASTSDVDHLPPRAECRVPEGSTPGAPPPWKVQANVVVPWNALTQDQQRNAVARVYYDPPFYARVNKVTTRPQSAEVVLDFGTHFGELRNGNGLRVFPNSECETHRLTILSADDAAPWNVLSPSVPLMEVYNQMLALYFADLKSVLRKRDWFTPDPGSYFTQKYGGEDGRRYAELWLHKCILDRMPMPFRGDPVPGRTLTALQVVGRTRRAIEHARSVVPTEVTDAIKKMKPVDDDGPDDDAEEEEDDDEEDVISGYVGYPERWFFGWTRMRAKIGGRMWKEWRAESATLALITRDGRDVECIVQGPNSLYYDTLAEYLGGWTRPNDGFYHVSQSALLNSAQLGSLNSTVGTRVHLRAALLSCVTDDPPENGWRALKPTVGRTLFFASAEMSQENTYRGTPGHYRISNDCAEFCFATQDTTAAYSQYGAGMDVRALVQRIFAAKIDDDFTCRLIATELPVLNPFCLFARKDTSKRFLFQQTQADFMCQLRYNDGSKRGPLVMGEYKCLTEVRRPGERIDNTRNFRQVLSNAVMFEAMTNIRVEYGVIICFTRRNRAYAVSFPIHDDERASREDNDFEKAIFKSTLTSARGGNLRVLYSDAAYRVALKTPDALTRESEGQDFSAAELFDVLDFGIPPTVDAPPPVPDAPAPTGYPGFTVRRANDQAAGAAFVLARQERVRPTRPLPDINPEDDDEDEEEEELLDIETNSENGGGGGGGEEEPVDEEEEEGEAEAEEEAEEEEVERAEEPREPRRSRRVARQAGLAPFVGAGPADFDRRIRTTEDVGQSDLYEAVKAETEDLADDVWHRLSARRVERILADVNAFYLFLREFSFQGRGVEPPDDWEEDVVRADEGRFAPMRAGAGAPLDRMRDDFLNPPKEGGGAPGYPTRRNDPDTGVFRLLTEDEKRAQVEAILCRTLNRLINDRVQRVYILPNVAMMERNAPVHPQNQGVTVRAVAERFLHNSQRAFWQPAALQWALETALPEERETLWAKIKSYNRN